MVAGGVASARPGALRRVGVVGAACDADVRRAGRRVASLSALSALPALPAVGSRSFAGLGDDVLAFASAWSSLEAWGVRVADAFERADSGGVAVGGVGPARRPLIGPALPSSAGAPVVVVPESAL